MRNKERIGKVAKGASISVKVVLVLCGMALTAFFAWLVYSIYSWLGM